MVSSPSNRLGIIGDKLHKYDTKTLRLLHVEKKKLDKSGTGIVEDRPPSVTKNDQNMDKTASAISVTREVDGSKGE